MNAEDVEVAVFMVHETDQAILVRDADDIEIWLPKSQVREVSGDVGEHVEITLPEWLAADKGLI